MPLFVANFHSSERVHFPRFSKHSPLAARWVLAPFLHPLCTPLSALEPPFRTLFAHPVCAGTSFLRLLCGGFSAPRHFARRAPNASTWFKSGFSSVHALPCSSGPLGLAKGKPLPRRSMLPPHVKGLHVQNMRERTSSNACATKAPPTHAVLTASFKGLCLCSAGILWNT